MSLVLIGLNHKTAPVEARERLAALVVPSVLGQVRAAEWREAAVLSTCNRFELVLADGGMDAARLREWGEDFLGRLTGTELGAWLYRLEGEAAVEHLFRVAAGLDSLVIGEAEILGQVKAAYEAAKAAGLTARTLNVLFQRALNVGKTVRNQTGITTGQTSVASVAVELAGRIFGDLSKSRVLILGAGKMAELSAKHFLSERVGGLFIANRTAAKGEELAARFRAQAVRWEHFPALLASVDIVIASTGAERPVVTADMVRAAAAGRRGRSLFFIDIAMPRDVEEGVHRLEHAYVYAMEDLRAIVEENLSKRRGELERAAQLVRARAEEWMRWHASAAAGAPRPLRHSSLP